MHYIYLTLRSGSPVRSFADGKPSVNSGAPFHHGDTENTKVHGDLCVSSRNLRVLCVSVVKSLCAPLTENGKIGPSFDFFTPSYCRPAVLRRSMICRNRAWS